MNINRSGRNPKIDAEPPKVADDTTTSLKTAGNVTRNFTRPSRASCICCLRLCRVRVRGELCVLDEAASHESLGSRRPAPPRAALRHCTMMAPDRGTRHAHAQSWFGPSRSTSVPAEKARRRNGGAPARHALDATRETQGHRPGGSRLGRDRT